MRPIGVMQDRAEPSSTEGTSGVSQYIVLNLGIINGKLFRPRRLDQKMAGPGELSQTTIAIRSSKGLERARMTTEHTMSAVRFAMSKPLCVPNVALPSDTNSGASRTA